MIKSVEYIVLSIELIKSNKEWLKLYKQSSTYAHMYKSIFVTQQIFFGGETVILDTPDECGTLK